MPAKRTGRKGKSVDGSNNVKNGVVSEGAQRYVHM